MQQQHKIPESIMNDMAPYIGHLNDDALKWCIDTLNALGENKINELSGYFWTDEALDWGVVNYWIESDFNQNGIIESSEGFMAREVLEIVGSNFQVFTQVLY